MIIAVAILGSALFAGTVSAAGLTQAQINAIVGLLQSFGANQSVINNVQISLSGGTPNVSDTSTTPASPVAECRRLASGMWVGLSDRETGNEVSRLQKFLRAQGDFTYSEITGFYGPATEEAVRRFQSRVGIVSGGNAETTGFGVVGSLTRAKIAEISCGDIYPYPLPTPKPIPVPSPQITVLSPNGGETWQKGTTQVIRWTRGFSVTPTTPAETSAVSSNTSTSVVSPNTVNISLTSYTPPCTTNPCPLMPTAIYLITSNALNTGEYRWPVGATVNSNTTVPDGAYMMQVCSSSQCDSSDSYFKIYSAGSNLPPVIDGVSGPTTLNVGETGTWSVKAHDPESGLLSYIVNWGDSVSSGSGGGGAAPMSISASQTTTFTHSYSRAGTYKVVFTITDNKGLTAQSSISVQVGPDSRIPALVIEPTMVIAGQNTILTIKITNALPNAEIVLYNTDPDSPITNIINSDVIGKTDSSGVFVKSDNANYGKAGGVFTYWVTVGGIKSNTVNVNVIPTSIQPSITVLSPNGGESWVKGTTQTIKWQEITTCGGGNPPVGMPCRVSSYDLKLVGTQPSSGIVVFPGFPVYTIAKSVSDSSYSWSIGKIIDSNTIIPDGSYTIQVCQSGTTTCDSSDSYFKITTGATGKVPPCGKYGDVDSDGLITSADVEIIRLHILNTRLMNEEQRARADVSGDGLISTLDITTINGYLVGTLATFPVCTKPSITVLAPNGGEHYAPNSIIPVSYSGNRLSNEIHVYLYSSIDGNVAHYSEFYGVNHGTGTGKGVLSFDINKYKTANVIKDGQYKVTLCDEKTDSPLTPGKPLCDSSDSFFTITAPVMTNAEIITALEAAVRAHPCNFLTFSQGTCDLNFDFNGDNRVDVSDENTMRNILTLSDSQFDTVYKKIMAAIDARMGLTSGSTNYESNFDVNRNGGIGQDDKTRISGAMIGSRVYPPTPPSITVLSPNGGEVWPVGSTQVINWNNTSGGPVNLTLSNYLACWTATPACGAPAVLYQLANSVSGSSYNWTTGKTASGGDIPAGEYKVTVSSATNGSVMDQSDSAFTIIAPAPTTSLNPQTVQALAEFSQKKNLNLASILAAIAQLIEAFK